MEIANDITAPTTRPDPSGRQRRLSLGSHEMGGASPLKTINPYGYACSFADSLCEIGQIFPWGRVLIPLKKAQGNGADRSIWLRSFRRMARNQNFERVSRLFSLTDSDLRIRFSNAPDLAVKLLQF
jgi:hypothetical protein